LRSKLRVEGRLNSYTVSISGYSTRPDNFIAKKKKKKNLRPKGADNTNNTQDNHQTDIFNTYHTYS